MVRFVVNKSVRVPILLHGCNVGWRGDVRQNLSRMNIGEPDRQNEKGKARSEKRRIRRRRNG